MYNSLNYSTKIILNTMYIWYCDIQKLEITSQESRHGNCLYGVYSLESCLRNK